MTSEVFADRIVAMQQTLYRICYSLLPQAADREDAVQACIEKAWHKRASLREDRYMQTWVVRILINECYAILRARLREIPREILPQRDAPPPGADIVLHDLFLSLDDKTRLPAVLFYMEAYSTKEIARMLRIPEGTVKSRLSRARERLREALAREEVYKA